MDERQTVAGTGVARRIASRTLTGLWQQKKSLALGAIVLVALGAYATFSNGGVGLARPRAMAPSADGDCADTMIAAMVSKTDDSLQQAYQCMDPTFQQRISQQQFARQVDAATGVVSKVARVGTYDEPNGSKLVYYALSTGNQSVGYIVYVGANGRIQKIE